MRWATDVGHAVAPRELLARLVLRHPFRAEQRPDLLQDLDASGDVVALGRREQRLQPAGGSDHDDGERVGVLVHVQNLLCLVAVNAVYTCGEQCNKEGKEKKVFAIFEAELALFKEQRGRWADVKEFTPAEFPKDSLRQTTKSNFITSEKIWERGMSMRRDLVNWLADYGKILNFTVLYRPTNAPEPR